MERSKEELKQNSLQSQFELLSQARKGKVLTVRDDQYDFNWLLDGARALQGRGLHMDLIDSGRLGSIHLEWLGEQGINLYTSDEARRRASELILINKALKRKGGIVAYFHYGALEAEGKPDIVPFQNLAEMGRSGVYLHLTNRERVRDFLQLNELAHNCRRGEAWLIYYHHGKLEQALEELARSGAWIHLRDQSLEKEEDVFLLEDVIEATCEAGTNLYLHLEKGMNLTWLKDIANAGAILLFRTPLSDYKSPFRALEEDAKRHELDFRTYYLHSTFLP